MELSATCMACIIRREEGKIAKIEDEQKRAEHMRRVLKFVAESPRNSNSPCLVSEIEKMRTDTFGIRYSKKNEKDSFNKLMLELRDEIAVKISAAPDPLLCALKFARAGNYIDFGAMKEVSVEKLMELLSGAEAEPVDKIEYKAFISDLDNAKKMVYITDNCGEVILDMLFIEQLQKKYPALEITALVRGKDALNDVTEEDARELGLPKLLPVVGNGTSVGGTPLDRIAPEAVQLLKSADIILAKGMGNFETMYGEGLPVYYAFLCKCIHFTRTFGLPLDAGVFIRESSVKI